MLRCTFLIPPLVALGACSSTTPSPYSEADFESAQAESTRVGNSPITAAAEMPTTDTAEYTGQLGGAVNGDVYGAVLGDLAVTANFGTGEISGSVTKIGFDDMDGDEDQLLSGSMDVAGKMNGNSISATATGDLGAVDENGFSGTSSVVLQLDGSFHSVDASADSMQGTVTGSGSGDYDLTLSSGEFYATK